jgi:uncharacterized protein YdeI (YjbR/CyaY-like superfamily)
MPKAPEAPTTTASQVQAYTRAAWRKWLAKYHETASGAWLVFYKKGAPGAAQHPPMGYDAMVEEALCFGWVDSKPQKLDDERSMLYFAPRKAKSGWSRPNKERVGRLIAEGSMHASGLAKIEAAKADGSWAMLDAVEALETPPDLTYWDAFPRSAKRGILEWIAQAKKPETRAARIANTAELAQRNERANQWKPK